MKLQMNSRTAQKKSESKKLRREGLIPSVIYIKGKVSENVAVPEAGFSSLLRQVMPGRLSTTVFTLADDGKSRRALIKEIQYHPTTYNVLHLDFEELHDKETVTVKVPIECIGQVDSVGIKLGGTLRQVLRYVRVSCLPKDIPSAFEVDVRNMGLNETKRLADLSIPESVRLLADPSDVAVSIVKR
jgi:large subunit ribosomal protein L25